jgi:hypothetical protein
MFGLIPCLKHALAIRYLQKIDKKKFFPNLLYLKSAVNLFSRKAHIAGSLVYPHLKRRKAAYAALVFFLMRKNFYVGSS